MKVADCTVKSAEYWCFYGMNIVLLTVYDCGKLGTHIREALFLLFLTPWGAYWIKGLMKKFPEQKFNCKVEIPLNQ